MNHSTGKPTRYEQQRFDAMMRLGCVCCAQLDLPNPSTDRHHIVEGNKRLGHWYTLPLCPGHHRGVWSPEQIEIIPPDLRTAISDGSKLFEKHYGTERELWMKVQARLKLPAIWPSSKILPRRECHVATGLVSPLEIEAPASAALHRGSGGDHQAGTGSQAVAAVAGEEP